MEVLVAGDEGGVLVLAAKVFEVVVLVDGKTEEDLVMDVNLLLSIIMRVQRCNRLIHYLDGPLLSRLHKIIINLRVSSVSLHPLKHRR